MTSKEIRKKFIDFFVQKEHLLIPSSPLVPENDSTLLLVNSGMAPIKPYFLGLEEPPSKRLVDIQKCIRMEDVEEVGIVHGKLTFFEMMGNWSIGDYGKKDALTFAWNLLVKGFGFNPASLWATVFAGAKNLPPDNEIIEIWKELGIPEKRIIKLGMDDNFWVSGPTGPCGPCTEVFYDLGEERGLAITGNNYNRNRLFEIWNACVSVQYNRDEKEDYQTLPFCSIDAGAGLERFSMVLQKTNTVFETDLFWPIIETIEKVFGGKKYSEPENQQAMRIIADHTKAAVFLIIDGVTPSNKVQGYVLRRLLRRAAVKARTLEKQFTESNFETVAESVLNIYDKIYFDKDEWRDKVLFEIGSEIKKFTQTLEKGLREVEKITQIDGKIAFNLYQTYGFPLELTEEIAREKGQKIDKNIFKEEFQKHQELSRTASAGMFKGGLVDHSQEVTKLHTATHLLHQALRQILSEDVHQVGSNITPERLRFDFTYPEKLTPKQIKQVEDLVNEQIAKDLAVKMEMMNLDEAKKQGALAFFTDKYKNLPSAEPCFSSKNLCFAQNLVSRSAQNTDQVKVYSLGNFSKEVCGGPHVGSLGEIGSVKIIKEESVGAGRRRIYAQIVEK